MGISPAVIAAIAASVSAAGGLAGTAYSMSQSGGQSAPKMPSVTPQDTSQLAKGMLPGAKADTAARTGGGISPDFLANVIGQQTGEPSAGLDILGEIRKSLGGAGGGGGI